ncbi:hypothetical protein D3C76_1468350 [compost metagenome]
MAIAGTDVAVNHAVDHQLRLRNTLSVAVFGFDVIFDDVAVEVIRQGDVNREVTKQHEAQILLCRAAHRVMQMGFRQGDALNQ